MKANKNSLHAKLYEFTYTSDLPINLCPYFWKLVWGTIIFIPNFILQLPALIIILFTKYDDDDDCGERRNMGGVTYLVLMLLFLYLVPTINWIKALFNCYSYAQDLAIIGGGFNSIIFIVSAFFFIKYHLRKRQRRIEKNRPNIVVEFVKAKYGKYCPKIDWE